jgi:hypothetical protein
MYSFVGFSASKIIEMLSVGFYTNNLRSKQIQFFKMLN